MAKIIALAANRMTHRAAPRAVAGPQAPNQQRAQGRKAQRTARKRNRPR